MSHNEWIGIPLHDGWIVRVVFRPEPAARLGELFEYDCICHIHVTKGQPIRMMIPEGVGAVVLTLCVEGGREHEHAPVPMTLAKLPHEPVN